MKLSLIKCPFCLHWPSRPFHACRRPSWPPLTTTVDVCLANWPAHGLSMVPWSDPGYPRWLLFMFLLTARTSLRRWEVYICCSIYVIVFIAFSRRSSRFTSIMNFLFTPFVPYKQITRWFIRVTYLWSFWKEKQFINIGNSLTIALVLGASHKLQKQFDRFEKV